MSEDERAAREAELQQEQAAAEYLPLPPTFERELRMQLADVAERAHQKRLDPDGYEPLGQGGGITAEVVRAMSEEIRQHGLPSPADQDKDRTLLLFGALAAAGLNPKEVHPSFVIVRDRLVLDVSTADFGEEPNIRFVPLPARPATADRDRAAQDESELDGPDRDTADSDAADRDRADDAAADDAVADDAAADDAAAEHDTAEHDLVEPLDGGELASRYAAVITGSAAVIADHRPFLGIDTLMTYARRRAFTEAGRAADPRAARKGMRVAHGIEIVVLLDVSLGGGVWVDVDPATGRPAATMSINLTQAGFEFLPLKAA